MDSQITFSTDTATIAVFDPAVLEHRLAEQCDWWCDSFNELPEVREGRIALLSTGGDDVYTLRITDGPLRDDEKAYAREIFRLGVLVESGRLFVGAGEHLPGEGLSPLDDAEFGRFFVACEPGLYAADIIYVDWSNSPTWYAAPGSPVPENAPADFVVLLRPRSGELQVVDEPRISFDRESWLFPELPRKIGPEVGMTIQTVVVKASTGLVLKHAGPCAYRPVLPDVSNLQWHDRIVVRVESVDHEQKEVAVSLVSIIR